MCDVVLLNEMRQEWFKLGCDRKKLVAFGKYVQIAQRIEGGKDRNEPETLSNECGVS